MAQGDNSVNGGGPLCMKLLIDLKSQKVLFAEAGKEVVDFLFSLLALPLATTVRLLGAESDLPGSIGKLYRSVEQIDSSVLVESSSFTSYPSGLKGELLNPTLPSKLAAAAALRLPFDFDSSSAVRMRENYYGCPDTWHYKYVTAIKGVACPRCSKTMDREVQFVLAGNNEKNSVVGNDNHVGENAGIVKGVIRYTITDDLTVAPLSTISTLSLFMDQFSRHHIFFEARTVTVGINEVMGMMLNNAGF